MSNVIYAIEFDTRYFIDPLNIDKIAREILEEYGNKPTIKSISHVNDKIIYTTTLRIPKDTIDELYQKGINIKFLNNSKVSSV